MAVREQPEADNEQAGQVVRVGDHAPSADADVSDASLLRFVRAVLALAKEIDAKERVQWAT